MFVPMSFFAFLNCSSDCNEIRYIGRLDLGEENIYILWQIKLNKKFNQPTRGGSQISYLKKGLEFEHGFHGQIFCIVIFWEIFVYKWLLFFLTIKTIINNCILLFFFI